MKLYKYFSIRTQRFQKLLLCSLIIIFSLMVSLLSVNSLKNISPILAYSEPLILLNDTDIETTRVTLEASYLTNDVELGDVDSDGDLDLIVANEVTPRLVLYLNVDGVFNEPTDWNPVIIGHPTDVEWGDADGDGDLDLAVATWGGNRPHQIFKNENGVLTDTPVFQTILPGGGVITRLDSYSVVWADLDGDGLLDLIFGHGRNNWSEEKDKTNPGILTHQNYIFQNVSSNGNIDFTHVYTSPFQYPTRDIAVADVNGDGYLDFAVANGALDRSNQPYTNTLFINRRGEGEAFAFEFVTSTLGIQPSRSLAWGNFNDDDQLELLVGNNSVADEIYCVVAITSNNVDMTPCWQSDLSYSTTHVEVADIDEDGKQDILLGALNQPNYILCDINIDNLAPTATHRVCWDSSQFGINLHTTSIAIGDVNHDGLLDIVEGTGGTSNTLQPSYIYYNATNMFVENSGANLGDYQHITSSALGDLDLDGDLDLFIGSSERFTGVVDSLYLNNSGVFSKTQLNLTPSVSRTQSVAFADFDQDGRLDLAVGGGIIPIAGSGGGYEPLIIYRNNASIQDTEIAFQAVITTPILGETRSLAWGDMNGDGYLDLAVGNSGDTWDDEMVFRGEQNQVFTYDPILDTFVESWRSSRVRLTRKVAWGDIDNDGDLDLIVANWNQPNEIYLNTNGRLSEAPVWEQDFANRRYSNDVAVGDVNGDGLLDITFANGFQNLPQNSELFINQGGTFADFPDWTTEPNPTIGIILRDFDNDGDLDMALSNSSIGGNRVANQLYINLGTEFVDTPIEWQEFKQVGPSNSAARSLISGDIDNDGDLDLLDMFAGAYDLFDDRIVINNRVVTPTFSEPTIKINQVGVADFYASSRVFTETVAFSFTLAGGTNNQKFDLDVQYSLNGVGNWIGLDADQYTLSTASPLTPTSCHVSCTIEINLLDNGIFGRTDNFVVRLTASPYVGDVDTQAYVNDLPGPFLYGSPSVTSYPFRIAGRQIQVMYDGQPAADAIVFRKTLSDAQFEPYRHELGLGKTDANGILRAIGTLNPGDQLYALLPTEHEGPIEARKFLATHAPTETGVDAYIAEDVQTQVLSISEENILYLFDIIVSLEWDARNEPIYLAQLEENIRRSSTILYDLTDGQMALGDINIYQNREFWYESHVAIFASNRIRPNADLGGIITQPLTITLGALDSEPNILSLPGASSEIYGTQTISNAIVPGQVRMPALWNRYGNPGNDGGDDWARALAHELSHYLLFLPDNYLQVDSTQDYVLNVSDASKKDCAQTYMTNAYLSMEEAEFLERTNDPDDIWNSECNDTVAEYTTKLSDWELISEIYGISKIGATVNGPNQMPLNITNIEIHEPLTGERLHSNPIFSVVDENGTAASLSLFNTQAYIFRLNEFGEGNLFTEVIPLGSPVANQIFARGAQNGDELCVYDNTPQSPKIGCTTVQENASSQIMLNESESALTNILLDVEAFPIIKLEKQPYQESVALSLTLHLTGNVDAINVELLPSYASYTDAVDYTLDSVLLSCAQSSEGISVCQTDPTIELPDVAYGGYIRIWQNDKANHILRPFLLGGGYGPNRFGYGPNRFGYGPNRFGYGPNRFGYGPNRFGYGVGQTTAWNAPVTSGDGQIFLFDIGHSFGPTSPFVIQSLQIIPNLPSWLTPIGNGYDITLLETTATPSVVDTATSITFSYLERDLPTFINESAIQIYYQASAADEWIALNTAVNENINLATAAAEGSGTYALMTTISGLPLKGKVWNRFSYPRTDSLHLPEALASIEEEYTSVYFLDTQGNEDQWKLFDRTVLEEFKPFVNDLDSLEPLNNYLIYALNDTQPFFQLPSSTAVDESSIFDEPPATFYGWVDQTNGLTLTLDSIVEAFVDGALCGSGSVTNTIGTNLWAYKIQIASDDAQLGCGQTDRNIEFVIDGKLMPFSYPWNNIQACFFPLNSQSGNVSTCFEISPPSEFNHSIYLPLVRKSPVQ